MFRRFFSGLRLRTFRIAVAGGPMHLVPTMEMLSVDARHGSGISTTIPPPPTDATKQQSDIREIGDGFLKGYPELTFVDLSPFSNVTKIGDGFLSDCSALTSVDLSPLSNVREIGGYFLSGCSSLLSVDLSALSNVNSIGTNFLGWNRTMSNSCRSLTSVDLSPLSNVNTLGNHF
eukprot:PhM_4_TR13323/c1_g1_i13/m.72694